MSQSKGLQDARSVRVPALVVGAICATLAFGACGSADKPSSGEATAAAGASKTDGSGKPAAAGQTIALPTGEAELAKQYAPGVPSLSELYEGTEQEPPSDGPPAAKDKSVMIVSCGQVVPACSGVAKAMSQAFDALGWKNRILDGQLNANNGWSTALRQAIAARPDAIVNALGMNCTDIKQPLQEAKDAGIPFFGTVSLDCDDPTNPSGVGKPLFAGNLKFNESALDAAGLYRQIGQQQAAAAIAATRGEAKVIRTAYTSGFGASQKKGQDEVLKRCSGCETVGSIDFVASDTAPGGLLLQRFQTTLSRYPDANVVIYNFDNVASSTGLGKALVDSGRAKTVTGVASEGYDTGLTRLRDKNGVDLVPAYSGKWIGWGTADMVNRYLNKAPMVPEGIGVRLVDREHNLPADGDYVTPIDYEAAYKKVWQGK